MNYKQYDIWQADLNPTIGTEQGKTRPVVNIQTDLLNYMHLSTIVCPITTNVQLESQILRIHLTKTQLQKSSDVLVDQPRAIDIKRFIKRLGELTIGQIALIKENLKIVLDL